MATRKEVPFGIREEGWAHDPHPWKVTKAPICEKHNSLRIMRKQFAGYLSTSQQWLTEDRARSFQE